MVAFATLKPFLDPLEGNFRSFVVAEGGQAEVPLAHGTKPAPRRTHHLAAGQEPVKEVEGLFPIRQFPPNVGGVLAAKNGVARRRGSRSSPR